MKNCLIIYRGPLQRSRLNLILSTYLEIYGEVDFIWLIPDSKYYHAPTFSEFIDSFNLVEVDLLDASLSKIIFVYNRIIRKLNKKKYNRIVLVGTTSIFFYPTWKKLPCDFFINGIPEERFFHRDTIYNKLKVFLIWKALSFYSVDRLFTVSKYMMEFLKGKVRANYYYSIPSGIYHDQEEIKLSAGNKMVYSGSGAPWQWLNQLSKLWQEIYRLDPSIEFLVVSRDNRTRILSKGLDSNAIKFVQGKNGVEVFNFLQDAKLGFLIRQDHLVNKVSFPIKFGEYMAAGLHVVVSDFDWECADFIKEYGGGLLVSNNELEREAAKIIKLYYSLNIDDKYKAKDLSHILSREVSKRNLQNILLKE